MTSVFYKDYTTFDIMGDKVNLISTQTENGLMTVVEIGNYFYYLGDEPPNIESVLFAYQDIKGIDLKEDTYLKIVKDNQELSDKHKTFRLVFETKETKKSVKRSAKKSVNGEDVKKPKPVASKVAKKTTKAIKKEKLSGD